MKKRKFSPLRIFLLNLKRLRRKERVDKELKDILKRLGVEM